MRRFFRALGSYVWWTHPRGSVHYDVMVTLILLFIFLAPNKINFKDKPATRDGHPKLISAFTAYSDERGAVVYGVPANFVPQGTAPLEERLSEVLKPYAGQVAVTHYEALKKGNGEIIGYQVWVRR
jgi:hypothetical protein